LRDACKCEAAEEPSRRSAAKILSKRSACANIAKLAMLSCNRLLK
jgi:hypothetical protein